MTLVLLAFIGVLLLLLFLPSRRSGREIGRVTHAAAQAEPASVLPGERAAVPRSHPLDPAPKPVNQVPLPPPGGVDAFGLPASGAFETGSARSGDHALSLASLAPYLPIWGYLEGQEVIVGGRVYHPGDQLVIRTPSGLCKAQVAQIDRHCLVLRDEERTEVRVPWPRANSGSGMPPNEVFVDPSPSER
ncbi:hypothetical protein [Methylacidimicrobium sp. B4]|uniref:hypothetical protein n=1 Tax=Methylacidimicrobium sp. B4 TaxID=2796139 RepID=UPI001A8C417C|nr:hypothetical protein [Methylacidimicrobium sp. B4]QSR84998.1 hypothetical protein MacB4_01630 [Methylacidimicrobium sp. B4]